MPPRTDWNGSLHVDDHAARWIGTVGACGPHRHFAAQAILSDRLIQVSSGGKVFAGCCILIEPHAEHEHSNGAQAELHFLEPSIRPGGVEELRTRLASASPVLVSDESARPFWAAWLAQPDRREPDSRIVEALHQFELSIARGQVRIGDFAPASGLSPGRFRHLFAAEMGLPFKRYVLWRRMRLALQALAAGAHVTAAAHEAGFSDAAHFSRTMNAMFGLPATALFRRTMTR